MSEFKERVITIVKAVPYGKVVSYGQVAAYTGVARAARQVGWILNRLESGNEVPWWRVVNNGGRISIKNSEFSAHTMKGLLQSEGVKVHEDFTFDIEHYRFRPSLDQLSQWQLDTAYIQLLIDRYGV